MKRLPFVAVLAVAFAPALAAEAQTVTCQTIGSYTFCSDSLGRTSSITRIGRFEFGSDSEGATWSTTRLGRYRYTYESEPAPPIVVRPWSAPRYPACYYSGQPIRTRSGRWMTCP